MIIVCPHCGSDVEAKSADGLTCPACVRRIVVRAQNIDGEDFLIPEAASAQSLSIRTHYAAPRRSLVKSTVIVTLTVLATLAVLSLLLQILFM